MENNNYTQQEPKESVVKGKTIVTKPKASKRIIDFLFSDKLDSISNYLAYYVLGPSLKNMIFQVGSTAMQMALFGGQGGQNMTPMGYNNFSFSNGYSPARREGGMYYNMVSNPGYAQPQPGIYQPKISSLDDISFDTKDDAYRVLDRMAHDIKRYGRVRVADFYTYAGITGQEANWTLQGYGWYDISQASPVMLTNGRWIIKFPPPMNI